MREISEAVRPDWELPGMRPFALVVFDGERLSTDTHADGRRLQDRLALPGG